jgi:hypothetical protein
VVGAALLLGGGVVVTTDTVWGDDAGGNGAATGLPETAVPQPATRAASSTTTCLPDMAGTLRGLGRLGYRLTRAPSGSRLIDALS